MWNRTQEAHGLNPGQATASQGVAFAPRGSRRLFLVCGALLLLVPGLFAQESAISRDAVQINLPSNSPLTIRGVSMGDSRATARGAALSLDLQMALTLENKSGSRIHG